MIEIASESLKYINKDKNGDHCVFEMVNKQVLLAAVADGVSQQPCDWKASLVACQHLVEHFKIMQDLPFEDRLKESTVQANEGVIAEVGTCNKMSTTLSAVCIDTDSNTVFWCNIGDSRIYLIRNQEINQLTIDDTQKRTKTILTDIGRRTVDASILTKSLGMDSTSLEIEVYQTQSQPGDTILLATDGFYNARVTFLSNMIVLAESSDLQVDFESLFKKYSLLAGDDMTAVVIRTQAAY